MSQYKRTYTFEQYATAWVDAALSVLPRENRQVVRPQVLKFYLGHKIYSALARKRRYTSKEYAWAIAWGLNTTGPSLLSAINKYGLDGVTQWMEADGNENLPKSKVKTIEPQCSCSVCRSRRTRQASNIAAMSSCMAGST